MSMAVTVMVMMIIRIIFFFNDTATTEIYTLSLHDAPPISLETMTTAVRCVLSDDGLRSRMGREARNVAEGRSWRAATADRKSTRLNSSHANISYAVFCLKKKKNSIHLCLLLIILLHLLYI